MAYLNFTYKDRLIVLDPDSIRDIRKQLQSQVGQMTLKEAMETACACGLSPKMIVNFLKKRIKEKL